MALLPAIPFLPQIRSCIQCRFVLYYGMYTKQNLKEGVRRGDYTGKLRRKAADSQRLCPSVSGKGLQAHNRRRDSQGNILHAKDGVLIEFVQFMFGNQFNIARKVTGHELPPVYVYALETSLQLTLTELNESLREVYLEAYRQPQSADYIYRHTASELYQIFGSYLPSYSECDFYEQDIGSSGIMRAYMERPCDLYFTLEKKLSRFLTMSMRAYCVPPDEQQQVLAFIETLDIRGISERVMQELFRKLEMQFSFSLGTS